jgi:hypothetical protein
VADNTTQTGTATIAADDVTTLNGGASSGVLVQRVKQGFGDDGTYRDVSATFPLPVNIAASGGNTAPVTQALTAAGAATLAGATSTTGSAVIDVSTAGNASFHLLATAFVGTVVFEQSFDPAGANGTWAPVPCLPEDGTAAPSSTLAINTAVAYVRQFTAGMFGPSLFRVRCTAFTSGSLTAYLRAGPGWVEGQPALAPSNAMIGQVTNAPGTTAAGTAPTTSGTANTNGQLLAADANRRGLILFNNSTGTVTVAFGVATTATIGIKIPPGTGYEVPSRFAAYAVNAQATIASAAVYCATSD